MIVWTRILTLGLLFPAFAPAQELPGPTEPEPAFEQPTRYRVEVVFFAHNAADPNEERLDIVPSHSRFYPRDVLPARRYVDQPMLRALDRQVAEPIERVPEEDVLPPFAEDLLAIDYFDLLIDPHVRQLDATELRLGSAYRALQRLEAYTPLFHAGWEQDGLAETEAVDLDMTRLGSTNPIGSIRLYVSRYLHARVDLAYRPPVAALPVEPALGDRRDAFGVERIGPASTPLAPVYYLYEERRLFRDEINYLDHPAFGVILLVTLAPAPEAPRTLDSGGVAPSA